MAEKVLITGAGGFIGSHLAEACVEMGYRVRAMVHYNSGNRWGWLEGSALKKELEIVSGDIRDYDFVFNSCKDCHTVFHLAALIGIPYSYLSPLAYVKTNIEGTYNLLQAARELGTKNLLITSTSETYGTAQYVPIDENHPTRAQSPYAASKAAADQLALSYYFSFGLPVKIVRPFNTFGPRQSARAIIPTIMTQLLSGRDSIRLGNLTPTRDLTFVKDTVRGFLAVSKSEACVGRAVNIGMDQEISVGELASLIGEILGRSLQVETEEQRVRTQSSEVERLRCANAQLRALTDWEPRYDLRSGLLETAQWLAAHMDLYKPELYNV